MLSIDITDRQIKLVIGVHSGNKIRVQDADIRELTLGMVSNGYITDVPMVAAELNDIIKAKGIKEKDAIVSITSSSIVYKELLLPKPKSLKNTVAIEAMIQSNMEQGEYTVLVDVEDEGRLEEQIVLYNEKKSVKIYDSIGKICGEYIIPYPPGICLVSPGEIITKEVIDYILVCHQKGMSISGMKDPSLGYIQIIENSYNG